MTPSEQKVKNAYHREWYKIHKRKIAFRRAELRRIKIAAMSPVELSKFREKAIQHTKADNLRVLNGS